MALNPGPVSIDSSYSSVGRSPDQSLWDRRDWLVEINSAHKQRINTVTSVVNGEWYVVWPDLSNTPEAPTVANLIELGIAHWSSIGGAMLPSVKVPVPVASDTSDGRRGARKRERRIRELWDKSNVTELAAMLWGDYAGAGMAVFGVWADFSKPPAKRDPYLIRFDPRHAYTLKDDIGNITEMLVARKISPGELKAMHPDLPARFEKSPRDQVEEWFWYSGKRFLHAVVDVSKDGRKSGIGIVLTDEKNDLDFVPAWEVIRPTFDGQRRGMFDQTLHLLRTMHRLMTLTIYSTEENAFPAILEFDTLNPGDYAPGKIIRARSSESRLERIGPANHFDVKDLIARLGDEAKMQSSWPQQLSGEPGASINSARGIQASMGALDARLNVAHKQFERGFGKVSSFLLAFDEIYCPGEKTIYGSGHTRRKAEMFDPAKHIAGAWDVVCTYGIGAGSDPASKEMRLQMHLSSGTVSMTTAREELDFLDDPEVEPIRIAREQTSMAILAGIAQQANEGNPALAAQLFKLLQTEEVDLDEVMEKIVELIINPPAPPTPAPMVGPQGGNPMDALAAAQGAESLARGGIPGNAEQAPPPQGSFGLPPMEQLVQQDSRQVM